MTVAQDLICEYSKGDLRGMLGSCFGKGSFTCKDVDVSSVKADWQNRETIVKFPDNSKLIFNGINVWYRREFR